MSGDKKILRTNGSNGEKRLRTAATQLFGQYHYENEVAIPNGATSVAVTFVNAAPDTDYNVYCTVRNTTDTLVQFQPYTITAKDTLGFTVKWNNPWITGNYVLEWMILRRNNG